MKKKILSVMLLVAVIFSTLSIPQVLAESDYVEDIAIMTSLGFLEKLNTEDNEAVVTRAEFAGEIVLLLGLDNAIGSNQWFDDVDKSYVYYEEIATAARNGIIHGTEGKFYPDRVITYLEAATMLVNALGGKDFAEYEGAYSGGYLKLAESLDIKKKVIAGPDTHVTIGMAARLLLNAGKANIFTPVLAGDRVELNKGGTLFWERQQIDCGTGIFYANQYTSIDKKPHAGKDAVRIGDFEGNLYYNSNETEYLGYYVEYYYREENGENTVYYIVPVSSKNEITVVQDKDIDRFDEDKSVLYYQLGSKGKHVNILSDMTVIFNGKLAVQYYVEKNGETKSIFDVDNGEIKLIDHNKDGKPEIISILSFEDYFVFGVNKSDGIIYDMYGRTELNFKEAEQNGNSWILTDAAGNVVGFESLKEKVILSVAASADHSVLRGVVCDKKLTGAISGKSMENNVLYAHIGGVEYEVYISKKLYDDRLARIEELKKQGEANPSVTYADVLPDFGTNVTVYFGYTGKIAAIMTETLTSGYAFVMKKYYDDVEDEYFLKMITQDGAKDTFHLAKTVKIDGESYKYNAGGLNVYMQDFSDYQMILYRLNGNNEITMIDTAAKDKGGSNDALHPINSTASTWSYFNSQNSFYGNVSVADKAVAFQTPPNDMDVKYDFDLYSIASIPSGFGISYTVKTYSSKEDGFLADCVQIIKGSSKADYNIKSPYMLVSDVSQTIDGDDNPTYIFTGYSNGKKVEHILAAGYSYHDDGTAIDAKDVVAGDLIKYCVNARQEITYLVPIKRMGRSGALGEYANNVTSTTYKGYFSHLDFCLISGYIQSREGNYLGLVGDESKLSSAFIAPDSVIMVEGVTNIYYVTKDRKTSVEKIDNSNLGILADYQHNRYKSEVYGILQNAHLNMLIVYGE